MWVGSGSQNGNEKNDVDMESGIFNCFNRKKNGVVSKQILRNG